jgi:drug/metabolite transporter (DMT)-like permease
MERRLATVPIDAVLITVVLLWSLDFTIQKYGVTHGVEPVNYAASRFLVGGACFALLLRVIGQEWRRYLASDLSLFTVAAFTAAGTQLCLSMSLEEAPASLIALLFGGVPAIILVISLALRLEGSGSARRAVLACVLSFGGVALVVAGSESGIEVTGVGVTLGVVGAVGWATHTVSVGLLSARIPLMPLAAGIFIWGAVPLTIVAAVAWQGQELDLNAGAWGSVAYGILVTIMLSNLLWFSSIAGAGPVRASLYANLTPFAGAVIAVLLLSEELRGLQVLGGGLLLVGILIGRHTSAARDGPERGSDTDLDHLTQRSERDDRIRQR